MSKEEFLLTEPRITFNEFVNAAFISDSEDPQLNFLNRIKLESANFELGAKIFNQIKIENSGELVQAKATLDGDEWTPNESVNPGNARFLVSTWLRVTNNIYPNEDLPFLQRLVSWYQVYKDFLRLNWGVLFLTYILLTVGFASILAIFGDASLLTHPLFLQITLVVGITLASLSLLPFNRNLTIFWNKYKSKKVFSSKYDPSIIRAWIVSIGNQKSSWNPWAKRIIENAKTNEDIPFGGDILQIQKELTDKNKIALQYEQLKDEKRKLEQELKTCKDKLSETVSKLEEAKNELQQTCDKLVPAARKTLAMYHLRLKALENIERHEKGLPEKTDIDILQGNQNIFDLLYQNQNQYKVKVKKVEGIDPNSIQKNFLSSDKSLLKKYGITEELVELAIKQIEEEKVAKHLL